MLVELATGVKDEKKCIHPLASRNPRTYNIPMNESFLRVCCERCGEWNDSADVKMVEHSNGTGEVVCKPCLKDCCAWHRSGENFESLFSSYSDEL